MELVPSLDPTPLSLDLSYGDGNDRLQWQTYDPTFTPASNETHIYEFTWTPKEVTFKVDGAVLKSYGADHPAVINQSKHQNIMFNMWAPRSDAHTEDWSAGRDDSTMPWYAKCDYIDYYSWFEDEDDFSFQWRENFETLDSSKWTVAQNAGFDQNLATYMDTQVFVEDGWVVLKLDHNSALFEQ